MNEPETKPVVIIGAGIAGIRAALDLAGMGVQVYMIEKEPSIGGHMAQLDKTFPTLGGHGSGQSHVFWAVLSHLHNAASKT